MNEEKEAQQDGERSRRSLRNAVIIFAIVEALVLVPVVLYLIFR